MNGCFLSTCLIILVVVLLSLAACTKTVYVPKPEYHEVHDTIIKKEVVEKEVIKEVTVRDSVSFLVKGDTVRIERWHYERDYSRERALEAKVDSLTKARRDSVPYPVEVPVVTNELTKWQSAQILLGRIFVFIVVVFFIRLVIRWRTACP